MGESKLKLAKRDEMLLSWAGKERQSGLRPETFEPVPGMQTMRAMLNVSQGGRPLTGQVRPAWVG